MTAGSQAFYEAIHDNDDKGFRKKKFDTYWKGLADRRGEVMPKYVIARERRKALKRAYDEARRFEQALLREMLLADDSDSGVDESIITNKIPKKDLH